MRITNVALASALVFLCSCGSGGPSNTGEGGVPPQPRTVVGTQIVTYVSETGTTDVPDDLLQTTIAAYSPDGDGGYTMYPGSATVMATTASPMSPRAVTYFKLEKVSSGPALPRWTLGRRCKGEPIRHRPRAAKSLILT